MSNLDRLMKLNGKKCENSRTFNIHTSILIFSDDYTDDDDKGKVITTFLLFY